MLDSRDRIQKQADERKKELRDIKLQISKEKVDH
jgi:hypothetical protein